MKTKRTYRPRQEPWLRPLTIMWPNRWTSFNDKAVSQSCNVLCWKSMRNMLRLFGYVFESLISSIIAKVWKLRHFHHQLVSCAGFSQRKNISNPELQLCSGGDHSFEAFRAKKTCVAKIASTVFGSCGVSALFDKPALEGVVKDVKMWGRVVELCPSPSYKTSSFFVSQRELKDSNKC